MTSRPPSPTGILPCKPSLWETRVSPSCRTKLKFAPSCVGLATWPTEWDMISRVSGGGNEAHWTNSTDVGCTTGRWVGEAWGWMFKEAVIQTDAAGTRAGPGTGWRKEGKKDREVLRLEDRRGVSGWEPPISFLMAARVIPPSLSSLSKPSWHWEQHLFCSHQHTQGRSGFMPEEV